METRSGEMVSAQVGVFDNIDAAQLNKGNFKLANGQGFVIKNEGTQAVELEVLPAGANDRNFVKTTFDVGWNPELVKEIKATSLSSLKLKFGY